MLPDISSNRQTSTPTIHGTLDLIQKSLVCRSLRASGHEDLNDASGPYRPLETNRIASVLDLYSVRTHFESSPGRVGDYLRRCVILHSLSPRINPSDSGNTLLVSVLLNLSKLLQNDVLMPTSQIDRVAHSFRTQTQRFLNTTNLGRYRLTLGKTCFPVQLDYQRNLSCVILLRYPFLKHNPGVLPSDGNVHDVVRIDILVIEVCRGTML